MNEGKKFEEDFKKSVSDNFFYYRFRDGTGAWDGGTKTRFQARNMCDCLVAASWTWFLELKSTKAKSIPFSMINYNNLVRLVQAELHDQARVRSAFVVNFRTLEETYWVNADEILEFMQTTERKSIPVKFFEQKAYEGLGGKIPQTKKRTRYTYDLQYMFQ